MRKVRIPAVLRCRSSTLSTRRQCSHRLSLPLPVRSQVQSLNLMKNLVRASISEISFQRNLFPSDCFKDTQFGNTKIRALSPQDTNPDGSVTVINADALRLTTWQEAGEVAAVNAAAVLYCGVKRTRLVATRVRYLGNHRGELPYLHIPGSPSPPSYSV